MLISIRSKSNLIFISGRFHFQVNDSINHEIVLRSESLWIYVPHRLIDFMSCSRLEIAITMSRFLFYDRSKKNLNLSLISSRELVSVGWLDGASRVK